ncbi:schlafen family member 12 [Mesocricetus auratus]|uniref:Schlafen family member 12 n=1 Tax=Mesocricetus auratus TaxID=10036 RepID=A0A3Q0D230_MESAU|nr:schlafen family member 12 [Mesocricetus auratus]
MAAKKMDIIVDPKSPSGEVVLNVGEVTLGIKSREKMQETQKKNQRASILKAVCALLNSEGGVVKAQIENQDYNFNKHGLGEDLDTSFKAILPLVQYHLDFKQKGCHFFISVKSFSSGIFGLQFATIATNLYMRNGASCVQMDLNTALQFLEDIKNLGLGSPVKTSLLDERPGENVQEDLHVQEELHVQDIKNLRLGSPVKTRLFDERPRKIVQEDLHVQEELHVQRLAAAFFNQTVLIEMADFSFSESKNVEYKSFETDNVVKRVKEILPQTVSAFANTDGGYLFIGLDEKKKQIIGFKADKRKELEKELEKEIEKLPVTHFCEEQAKIKYTCKFIPVRRQGAVCSYVCALRVERFCCAVFAAEPDSWHVEGSRVRRFTTEEWVRLQMAKSLGSRREINV